MHHTSIHLFIHPSVHSVTYSFIDSYIHLRRDGTIINNTNPSALILTLGVSTMGNTGNRYVDFEIFHNRIAYNTTTGAFSNSGPSSTGGHTPWTFSATGNVNSVGDMTVSCRPYSVETEYGAPEKAKLL